MDDIIAMMAASGLAYDLMNEGFTASEIDELINESENYNN